MPRASCHIRYGWGIAIVVWSVSVKPVNAGEVPVGQNAQVFESMVSQTLQCNYLLFIPQAYHRDDSDWPLILYLHGAGERGDDPNLIPRFGPLMYVKDHPDFPFIVLAPQCPQDEWWRPETVIHVLIEVLDRYRVDRHRIYITGISMGGYGAMETAARFPWLFAAVAPVCGGGNGIQARALKEMPVWIFHGAKDTAIPTEATEYLYQRLQQHKADVKLTIYPEAGHVETTQAYDDPALYEWFLAHQRQSTGGNP